MSIIDKRRNFRVSFVAPIPCKARISSINRKKISLNKFFPVYINDLSASGMKIKTEFDLPLNKNIILHLAFNFVDKSFALQGSLIWKDDKVNQKIYGVKFIDLTEKEERQLVYDLNKFQLEKTRSENAGAGNRESPAARMLHAIPYPAILITAARKVLALNEPAEKLGVAIGGNCYSVCWENSKACSFCMLGESPLYNGIISYPVRIRNKKYVFYWLYLGKKIFLHYWKKV